MCQTSDILYYEVLDIPLPELQALKTLKVTYHHATKDEVIFLGSFSHAVDVHSVILKHVLSGVSSQYKIAKKQHCW
jgi:hypothetical protein